MKGWAKKGWNETLDMMPMTAMSSSISSPVAIPMAVGSIFAPRATIKGAELYGASGYEVVGFASTFIAPEIIIAKYGNIASKVGGPLRSTLIDFNTVDNVAPGFYRANPTQLRFTQSDASPFFSKGGTIDSLVADLQMGRVKPEQVGSPLQIVMYEGKPFSIDNRRLVAFNHAGVTDAPIQVMSLKDSTVATRFFNRFDPIGGEGWKIVITPSSGRANSQQLLKDYGLIKGVQLGN